MPCLVEIMAQLVKVTDYFEGDNLSDLQFWYSHTISHCFLTHLKEENKDNNIENG